MRRRIPGCFGLLLAGVVLAGCNDSTNPGPPCADPEGGSYVGSVSGVHTGARSGCASYAVTSGSGTSASVISISVGPLGSPTTVLTLVRIGARPDVGTYPIGFNTGEFSGNIQVNPGSGSFTLSSGSVTIDASTAGDLRGSFTVTGAQAGSGNSLTMSGTFTAVCTPGGSVAC